MFARGTCRSGSRKSERTLSSCRATVCLLQSNRPPHLSNPLPNLITRSKPCLSKLTQPWWPQSQQHIYTIQSIHKPSHLSNPVPNLITRKKPCSNKLTPPWWPQSRQHIYTIQSTQQTVSSVKSDNRGFTPGS